jgi:hypothetical protein
MRGALIRETREVQGTAGVTESTMVCVSSMIAASIQSTLQTTKARELRLLQLLFCGGREADVTQFLWIQIVVIVDDRHWLVV